MKLLATLGRTVLSLLGAIGRVALYALNTITHVVRPPFYPREFLSELLHIGWLSLPVVGLTAIFTGAALALQIYAGGARFNAESVVPSIVAIGMVRMTHWDTGTELEVDLPDGTRKATVQAGFWA